jgi:predicted patatin/cPLA2 family phospholipase
MPSDMDKNENQKFRRLEELILANEIKFQEILQEKEARYQTELKEKDHQIEQIKSQEKVHQKELLAVRKKLSDIYSSYGWKYLSTFYKIINSIPFVN